MPRDTDTVESSRRKTPGFPYDAPKMNYTLARLRGTHCRSTYVQSLILDASENYSRHFLVWLSVSADSPWMTL